MGGISYNVWLRGLSAGVSWFRRNILSTDPQLSISQKALGTLSEDGNVMLKHVGATTHN
jgi:hypothetical protein